MAKPLLTLVIVTIAICLSPPHTRGESQLSEHRSQLLAPSLHHLRIGDHAEWSTFPTKAESETLTIPFESPANQETWCLRWRQQDVKQS